MSHREFTTEPFYYEDLAQKEYRHKPSSKATAPSEQQAESIIERPLKRSAFEGSISEPQPEPELTREATGDPAVEPRPHRKATSAQAKPLFNLANKLRNPKTLVEERKNFAMLSHGFCFVFGFLCCALIAFWFWPNPQQQSLPSHAAANDFPPIESEATLVEDHPVAEALSAEPITTPPSTRPQPAATPQASGNRWVSHRIQPGETVRHLSAKFETSERELYLRNGGRFVPRVGQMILVPQKNFSSHVVKRGESLHVLAQKYGTDVAMLKQLNGLSSTTIKVGQPLRLP